MSLYLAKNTEINGNYKSGGLLLRKPVKQVHLGGPENSMRATGLHLVKYKIVKLNVPMTDRRNAASVSGTPRAMALSVT